MNLSDYDRMELSSEEELRLLRQEELIVEVTEAIAETIEKAGISQKELAERLECTKGYVSQLLGGGRNLTLRTLSDVAHALDSEVQVELRPRIRGAETDIARVDWRAGGEPWQFEGSDSFEETFEAAA